MATAAVGLDSGKIKVYTVKDFKKGVLPLMAENVHTKRVMGLKFSERRKKLFSIGEDGFLRVINLQNKVIQSESLVAASKLTDFCYDDNVEVAVISDRNGVIHFYDTSSVC